MVIGLVSVFLLNRLLISRLQDQLLQANDRLVRSVIDGRPVPSGSQAPGGSSTLGDPALPGEEESRPPPLPPGTGIGGLSARIPTDGSTGQGTVSTADNIPGERLSQTQIRVLAAVPTDHRTHTVALGNGLGDFLVIADTGPQGNATLITGLALHDIEETTLTLTLVITGVAATGLLAAGLAGTAIVRLTLRPLRRVAATARRVAQLPLDRGEVALAVRVPDVDTDDHTEVGQVGHALNRMLEHVTSALQVRQDSETRVRRFVSDASHELRTPLASIRGYAELTRRSRAEVSADVAYALERVESEAQRMTHLVEELLLLARLDEGRPLDRASVDLSELVVDAVSDVHVAGTSHQWSLDLPDDPVIVLGDQHRLHQVIANLLTNARTHTPAGTSVVVNLLVHGGIAEVRIADNGPGIPPQLLPQVFDRFARADTSRSRTAGSTGLGLAIVQAVIRAHGGRVEVTSRPGETVFSVRLPLDPVPESALNR
jgi:two-component system OmpR family sensor kinase